MEFGLISGGNRHRTDEWRKLGRLRDELQMLPPATFGMHDRPLRRLYLLSRLFSHRFRGDGALGGHSFGIFFWRR